MKKTLIALSLCTSLATHAGTPQLTPEREQHLSVIKQFLNDSAVRESLESKHGTDVDALMRKISKFGDWQLKQLAKRTPNLIQYGGTTNQVESKTAERISDKWINVAYLAIAIPVILLLLL